MRCCERIRVFLKPVKGAMVSARPCARLGHRADWRCCVGVCSEGHFREADVIREMVLQYKDDEGTRSFLYDYCCEYRTTGHASYRLIVW